MRVRVRVRVAGLALAGCPRGAATYGAGLRSTEVGREGGRGGARGVVVPPRVWRTDLYALAELLEVPVHVADGAQRVVGG